MLSDRRMWAIAGALVLVVVAVILAGRAATATVRSDDGRVTLSFHPEDLPAGTSVDDVTVRAVPPDAMPLAPGIARLAGYELAPDGIQLRGPATLTIELGLEEPPALLLAAHVAGDAWEVLDLRDAAWDDERGTLTIRSPISHFSSAFYYRDAFARPGFSADLGSDPISMTVAAPTGPVAVGSSFQVAATIRSSTTVGRAIASIQLSPPYRGAPHTLIAERLWTFSGKFIAGRPFSPRIVSVPPEVITTLDLTFTALQTFRCDSPGNDEIRYSIEALVDVRVQEHQGGHGHIRTYLTGRAEVECVGSGATPAPASPSPTAGTTAPPTGHPTPSASPTGTPRAFVCGLPGGPTCPPRPP